MERTKATQKDQYFQYLRGVCMMTVVFMHSKSISATGGWEIGYWITMRQLTNFAVATFVFMAGYFSVTMKNGRGGVLKRLIKLVIPYVIWSLFYCMTNGVFSPKGIAVNLARGTSSVQLYYLVVLIELTLLTPLLWRATNNRVVSIALLSVTPLYLTVVTLIQYAKGIPLSWKGKDFAAWITFYYLGMLVSQSGIKCWMSLIKAVGLVAISFVMSLMESFAVYGRFHNESLAISQIKLSSFIFALSVVNLYCLLHDKVKVKASNWIVGIGNVSFGIYFMHPFVIRCENYFIDQFGVSALIPLPVFHALQTALTVYICCCLIKIIKLVDKKGRISWIIGA